MYIPILVFHTVNCWLHQCLSWLDVLRCHLIPYNNLKLRHDRPLGVSEIILWHSPYTSHLLIERIHGIFAQWISARMMHTEYWSLTKLESRTTLRYVRQCWLDKYRKIMPFVRLCRLASLANTTCSLPVKLASLTRSPSMATFTATYFSSLKIIFIGTSSVFLTGPEECAAGTNDWRSWRSKFGSAAGIPGLAVSRLGHHQYLARCQQLSVGLWWLIEPINIIWDVPYVNGQPKSDIQHLWVMIWSGMCSIWWALFVYFACAAYVHHDSICVYIPWRSCLVGLAQIHWPFCTLLSSSASCVRASKCSHVAL